MIALELARTIAKRLGLTPPITLNQAFYEEPRYIDTNAVIILESMNQAIHNLAIKHDWDSVICLASFKGVEKGNEAAYYYVAPNVVLLKTGMMQPAMSGYVLDTPYVLRDNPVTEDVKGCIAPGFSDFIGNGIVDSVTMNTILRLSLDLFMLLKLNKDITADEFNGYIINQNILCFAKPLVAQRDYFFVYRNNNVVLHDTGLTTIGENPKRIMYEKAYQISSDNDIVQIDDEAIILASMMFYRTRTREDSQVEQAMLTDYMETLKKSKQGVQFIKNSIYVPEGIPQNIQDRLFRQLKSK
jgi:hypothetical protein